MSKRIFAMVAGLILALAGCEVTSPPLPSRILGAQHITFRCAPKAPGSTFAVGTLGAAGAPLDGCGCTQVVDGMLTAFDSASCLIGNAEVRAYVAGNGVGEVSAVRLNRGPFTGEARILDSDETIPEVTGIYVEDLVSDIESEPNGQFVLVVNSSTGTISVIVDDFAVRPDLVFDPGLGPLSSIAVWPPIERALGQADPAGGVALDGARRAWVTAPASGQVGEIDLEAVARRLAGEDILDDALVTTVLEMPEGAAPGPLTVHPDGDRLYVGHAAAPALTVFDLATGAATATVELSRQPTCTDGYLADVVGLDDDRSCNDGLDNDGDGIVDAADPDCVEPWGSESVNPACPQRFECADGVDNDGDGLIDAEDDDCDAIGRWERPAPVCADGVDNDGDGLIDAADPGCLREDGADEGADALGFELDAACDNGLDDDADGLIDAEDPGCTDPNAALRYDNERPTRCNDGIDNDGDGLIDHAGGDRDCYAAADDTEGAASIEAGPSEMIAVRFVLDGRARTWLYTTEARGFMVAIDLDDPDLRPRFTGVRGAVQGMAIRQRGLSTSMLTILEDSVLRSMEITEPAPLRTVTRRDIFARLPSAWSLITIEAPFRINGARVDAFFTIEDGVAARIDAMDAVCPVIALPEGEGATCDDGRTAVDGICAPAGCTADADCGSGLVCLDGTCARPCGDSSACRDDEICEGAPLEDGTTSEAICRTRCRLDDVGRIEVAPLADPCAGADCGAACVVDADCGAATRCSSGACTAWCTADGCTAPFDASTATALDLDRALFSPLVMQADQWRLLHDEANIIGTARGRAPRVLATPIGAVRNAAVTASLERYPAFCRIPQRAPGEPVAFPDDAWVGVDCVPETANIDAAGNLSDPEDPNAIERLQTRSDGFPGIQVVEENRGALITQDFTLAFNGELPRAGSRTGTHQGLVPLTLDPELIRSDAIDAGLITADGQVDGWTLVDADNDFCNAGVEVGDLVLVERMVPRNVLDQLPAGASASEREAASVEQQGINTRCAPFTEVDTALPPDQRRDPLRWRVHSVTPFKLVLRPDGLLISDTADYDDMLPRDERIVQPRLAAPRPSPAAECMVELTTYQVRVDNEFVLVGSATGYRHPWVRDGGVCVEDPQRIGRRSRVAFDVPFENEWLRFRIGRGDPEEERRPYMIDFTYVFPVSNGYLFRTLGDAVRIVQGMRWLPNNDLLYVVDGAIQTLVEIGGLDVFAGDFFVSNRSYD